MANWTDLSSAFGAYEILSSANMQQLRDNITAAFEQASGSPLLANSYVNSSMIGSGQIGALHIAQTQINSYHYVNASIGSSHVGSGQIGPNHLSASVVEIKGDGTGGRVLRTSRFYFTDGTSANTIELQMVSQWNGDSFAAVDNIPKGGGAGDVTLDGAGTSLIIGSDALNGDCIAIIGVGIAYGGDNAADPGVWGEPSIGGIRFQFQTDVTGWVDSGAFGLWVTYLTSA